MKKKYLLIAIAAAVFTAGCSEDPPAIQQLYLQLNVFDDREKDALYESLSLWVHPQDEGGIEDIEYLYLVQDEQELVWVLDSETWEKEDRPGENWIGSNDVLMPDLSAFPRGEYRIIVVDAAGKRDERTAYISQNKELIDRIELPEILTENESVTVTGLGDRSFHLWVYDQNGSFRTTVTPTQIPFPFADFLTSRGDGEYRESFFIYLYDHDLGCGVKSGPYYP